MTHLGAVLPPPGFIPPDRPYYRGSGRENVQEAWYFTPSCPQYWRNSGGIIQRANGTYVGNCSPNSGGSPFAPPYDFYCNGGMCYGTNGGVARSPDGVCCAPVYRGGNPHGSFSPPYKPRPSRNHPCCRSRDVNSCAICLDDRQGLSQSDAAGHFANMGRCRRMCGM
jgi:hypothetical protein